MSTLHLAARLFTCLLSSTVRHLAELEVVPSLQSNTLLPSSDSKVSLAKTR